ncbi:hypothetical protein JFQ93_000258 [Aeromonas sobria]|nr:hypothetical protein [Aeromonas sobria]
MALDFIGVGEKWDTHLFVQYVIPRKPELPPMDNRVQYAPWTIKIDLTAGSMGFAAALAMTFSGLTGHNVT